MSKRGGPQHIPRPERWRVGGPPAWGADSDTTLEQAAKRISAYDASDVLPSLAVERVGEPRRASAVLVPLFEDDTKGLSTILTRRPLHMRNHAGEISFAGGSVDDVDTDLWDTATREALEEIGLEPPLVNPIGRLDKFVTGASHSLVTPMVGSLNDLPELRPDPGEVDEILIVPIAELASSDTYRSECWYWANQWVPMHFFDLEGDTIWGATARMLDDLLAVILDPQG